MDASPEENLERLQSWYAAQCDGTWEHSFGITIDTLDNPGWSVAIDLPDRLGARGWDGVAIDRSEVDWIRCWIEDGKFHGAGGVRNLGEILRTFLLEFDPSKGTD